MVIRWFLLFAVLGVPGLSHAEERAAPFIWFRSAEGCPDGEAFLQRLEARGVRGRLAHVGDPVDFVVTLGTGAGGARGLLERQTATGTVAVRDLDGDDCEQVADAMALVLAVADAHADRRPPAAAQLEESRDSPDRAPESTPTRAAAPPSNEDTRRAVWSVGAQGGALAYVTPSALAGGNLFLQLEPWGRRRAHLGPASFRAYIFGQASPGSDASPSAWIAGGRLEGCPIAVGAGIFSASPCVGIDLGSLGAAGSGANSATDQGIWA